MSERYGDRGTVTTSMSQPTNLRSYHVLASCTLSIYTSDILHSQSQNATMESPASTVDQKVQQTLDRLEPLLKRTPTDPRPVVLMTCGVAGQQTSSHQPTVTHHLIDNSPRLRQINPLPRPPRPPPQLHPPVDRQHHSHPPRPLRDRLPTIALLNLPGRSRGCLPQRAHRPPCSG